MVSIVYTSPFQDEVDAAAVGLIFRRGEPQLVTEDQAALLLGTPYFEKSGGAKYVPPTIDPPPPAASPDSSSA